MCFMKGRFNLPGNTRSPNKLSTYTHTHRIYKHRHIDVAHKLKYQQTYLKHNQVVNKNHLFHVMINRMFFGSDM